ncbi:50S ribosomal protein L32 [Candidatus Hodgkinia cicadicola]|nr:50S ribosomal protein L32 [Candidatus Hodgkinia cicadicola]
MSLNRWDPQVKSLIWYTLRWGDHRDLSCHPLSMIGGSMATLVPFGSWSWINGHVVDLAPWGGALDQGWPAGAGLWLKV